MKRLLRRLAFFLVPKPRLSVHEASILMYHSVGENGAFFTVTPADFARQMRYLTESGRRVVPLRELCRRLRAGEPLGGIVVLTFDDGYADTYENAFPVLKKHGFAATVFVTTRPRSALGIPFLSRAEIGEMAASGLIDIMPHSVTHTKLHGVPFQKAVEEAELSRKDIEAMTGKSADLFAYPSGRFTSELVGYLRESGTWLAAATVEPGLVAPGDDRFLLRRNAVDSATSFSEFKAKVSRGIKLYRAVRNACW